MDRFYAGCVKVWINGPNPVKTGDLPPIPVDNCVENVDFCIGHASVIHFGVYTACEKVSERAALTNAAELIE